MAVATTTPDPHEHPARTANRWKQVAAVVNILAGDIRGELGAFLLENATDETWNDLARRGGVNPLSGYGRALVVAAIRRRGGA